MTPYRIPGERAPEPPRRWTEVERAAVACVSAHGVIMVTLLATAQGTSAAAWLPVAAFYAYEFYKARKAAIREWQGLE